VRKSLYCFDFGSEAAKIKTINGSFLAAAGGKVLMRRVSAPTA
jgi:hypothetical protein